MEILSKTFYPSQLRKLDPDHDYHEIITRFTHLPDDSIILSYRPGQTH
jgi:iron complex transport system substrate-binding protein